MSQAKRILIRPLGMRGINENLQFHPMPFHKYHCVIRTDVTESFMEPKKLIEVQMLLCAYDDCQMMNRVNHELRAPVSQLSYGFG